MEQNFIKSKQDAEIRYRNNKTSKLNNYKNEIANAKKWNYDSDQLREMKDNFNKEMNYLDSDYKEELNNINYNYNYNKDELKEDYNY